jgi:hypothetical protein
VRWRESRRNLIVVYEVIHTVVPADNLDTAMVWRAPVHFVE